MTTVLYVLSNRDARGIVKFDIDGVEPSTAAVTAVAGKSMVDNDSLSELLRGNDGDGDIGVEDMAQLSHWWCLV